MKLSEIKPNPNNPRVLRDDRFAKLKQSIEEFPKMLALRPMVVDNDGVILGGNMRYRVLQDLGYKEIPDEWVKRADELTEDEKRRFIIADNVGFGDWDWDELGNNWDQEELVEWGLEIPGWGEEEVEAEDDEYEMPNEIETDIQVGDLFEITNGEITHRLLCGDSMDSDAVAKLMNGNKADIVFTDPPFDLEEQENDWVANNLLFTKNAHVFIMHDDRGIVDCLRKSGLHFSRFFIADFGFASPRGNDPYLRHILISHEKNGNPIPHKNLHDGFSSIVKMDYRGNLKDEQTTHKHQKSIEFISKFIEHYSDKKNIVADWFGGSGSTMVAAHQLQRVCYIQELEPKYCQAIIDRMKALDEKIIINKVA